MLRRIFLHGLLMAAALFCCALPLSAATPEPRPSPEFVINMIDGRQVLLSQFRGRVVALEFGFTTCPHCQAGSQTFSRLQKEFGPRGFQAIGVAFNPMALMLLPDYIRQYVTGYPVGYSNPDSVHQYLGVPVGFRMVVPQLAYIDRKGVIRDQSAPLGSDQFFEEKNIRAMIESLLKEAVPARKTP